jgi:hypothetical protein
MELEDVASGLGRITWRMVRTEEIPPADQQQRQGPGGRTRDVRVEQGSFETALVRPEEGGGFRALTPWRAFSVSRLPVAGR